MRVASATETPVATRPRAAWRSTGEAGGAPEPLPLTTCALDPCLGTLDQPSPLLLRDPPEDRDEEGAHGTAGIEPALADGEDRDVETVKLKDRVDRPGHAPVESVERPQRDRLNTPGANVREHSVENRRRSARGLARKDASGSGSPRAPCSRPATGS
jgi:hypothetical protein